MWTWFIELFRKRAPRRSPTRDARPAARTTSAPVAVDVSELEEMGRFPSKPATHENADAASYARLGLSSQEIELMRRIKDQFDAGHFDLPQLPSTSMAMMDMASNPRADAAELADKIGVDPVLSSELMREANSVLSGARIPAATLGDAISRLGLRRLRSMILALSMRSVILRTKTLQHHATEIWRQAYSVANLARVAARATPFDSERAFLVGLLHDIGKISILHMVSGELGKNDRITMSLLGRLFLRYHEAVGSEMAKEWKLPDEIVSVAAHHHQFATNEEHPEAAALASLAHRMDLFLSMGAETEYRRLAQSEEMDVLAINPDRRSVLLDEGIAKYCELHASPAEETEKAAAA